jgi:lauroyl/myristoyl acyltransferase
MSQDSVYENWGDSGFNTALVFRLSNLACRLLSQQALYAAAENIFDWHQAWKLETIAAVTDNLAKAFPDRDRYDVESWASRTFTNYARGMVDYLRASFDPPVVEAETAGAERRLASGGGQILVTAHMGHWEIGGGHMGKTSKRHWVVGFPERDGGVEAFRESWRSSSGHSAIMAGKGLSTPFAVRRALDAGDNVVVLVDRATSRDRVPVAFRGRRAFFLKSPALFSALTGAPLTPVAVMREGPRRYSAHAGQPVTAKPTEESARAVMQHAADFFGAILERYPDQWYNFFRYWQEAP